MKELNEERKQKLTQRNCTGCAVGRLKVESCGCCWVPTRCSPASPSTFVQLRLLERLSEERTGLYGERHAYTCLSSRFSGHARLWLNVAVIKLF